ncbi:DsbA family oxidoreductase [Aquabacterium sp.]|uniref:DsbA family oxidoreductase n=1 Tax=Aquabacterium sp. TaxID=1872578 RepID=UPI002D1D6577|nr:DsbA family oxidoreductase [Aquabacterium sp.]HSW05217.1 DsbA family oxidoreductase [Aquabacterium sp.]
MQIDFISDVACPWCAVGLHSLEKALAEVGSELDVTLRFQPFELNPTMAAEGDDTVAYLGRKYGISAAQIRQNQAAIRERGAAVGFTFGERNRVWNTFNAHRLLHWAGLEGRQRELKLALLQAYHGEGRNPGDAGVLTDLAGQVGLDVARAREILASDEFAAEVREAERHWADAGIQSVPAVVIDGRHLIQGAQPPEVFAQALRQVAAQG